MLRNYFTIALRNLRKNKLHSFINLAGLSIGLACCLLIFIYVQRELSYDRFHEKSKQIYRLTAILHLPKEDRPRAVTSPPMGPTIRSNFPEVQNMVRINYSSRFISYQNNKQFDLKIIYADSTFFDIFTFPLIESIDSRPLEKPFSVVLTESTAKKYFGDEDPIGKTVQLSDTIPLRVTGLIADVPQNSHFSFDCLMSRSTIDELNQRRPDNNWFNNNYYTYLLLKKGTNATALEKKVSDYILSQMEEAKKASGLWYDLKLQPLRDIHLKSNLNAEIGPNSDISYIYIFSAAAIFILLIACSNFINLSTAKSLERTKEIGLRKTVGARRPQLMLQFLGESLFFCLVAGIVSLILVITSLPYFNQLTGLNVELSDLKDPMLIGIYVGVIIFVSVVAGLYPAILLSSFQPVLALKESVKGTVHHLVLKKGLVVFQFVVAIGLIIGTIVVYRQLRYIQERNLGLDKEQVVQVEIPPVDQAKGSILQTSLATNPHITNVSLNDFSFSNGFSSVAVLPEGANENELNSLPVISVDEHFIPTFKIALLTGRNFSSAYPSDVDHGFILNETAAKHFGWTAESALGKGINWGLGKEGKVIGVVRDFNFSSLHENIRPLILHMLPESYDLLSIRIQPGQVAQTLSEIETSWKKAGTSSPLEYRFMDEDFLSLYKADQKMQSVLAVFTFFSIFIACLGIFGLSAYTIRQRLKEIGVRKVLGASSSSIVWLFSKELLTLILISIVVASTISYSLMNMWLQDFAYHVDISIWIFIVAGSLTLLISFLTVSAVAFKASLVSPSKNLHAE